ncbi:MAG: hypothetical protein M3Q03_20640 [Chloroflexota bacterium]|nr:hypothetical protein [Chloroflexota bacterium]
MGERARARGDPAAALREQVTRLRGHTREERKPLDLGPLSAHEAVTRQMVEALADDLEEIKGRLNGLLFMVAGAIVVDVTIRIAGVG